MCDTTPVNSLLWGVRDRFRRYIADLADGSAAVSRGATASDDGRFGFPLVGIDLTGFEPFGANLANFGSAQVLRLRFTGAVTFSGHGGLINAAIVDPWLDTGGRICALSCTTATDHERITLAVGEADQGVATANGESLLISLMLAPDGVPLFGSIYPPGTDLAPASLRVPIVRWPSTTPDVRESGPA